MTHAQPLVSIGIPTFNRAELLKRSIETSLDQDYRNIEVIVLDNASTDSTRTICDEICKKDYRLTYIRHPENLGPTENFAATVKAASGKYFMWLGDDDWIDASYVSKCLQEITSEPNISLVSGSSRYYQNGQFVDVGKYFSLINDAPWLRVISYIAKVDDNGMFYGLMRTSDVNELEVKNVLGGDWLLIAALAFIGKIKVISDVSIHRELGGATTSYRRIAETLELSKINYIFPMLTIAVNIWIDIVITNNVYSKRTRLERVCLATIIAIVHLGISVLRYSKVALRLMKIMVSK